MNQLLRQLTEAAGVSSDEKEIRLLIRDLVVELVDNWQVDNLGNLIVTKKGTGDSDLHVLVDAHMDEVGMMITGFDRDGTCKFMTVGGIDSRSLLGKVVQVGPNKINGVIGARPIHLLKADQRDKVVKVDAMRIDIGAKSKAGAARKVNPGDTATFFTKYEESGDIAFGKAFDDRAGCAAMIELLMSDPFPFDLTAAFTVQEEVGLRGAQVVAYATNPDVALVLECTPAFDLPNKRDISPNVAIGKGPSIYVMDAGTIQDPRLVSHITRTAEAHDIPFQIRQPGGGGTNSAAIQRAAGAVPVATIATPGRYVHSPVSMISLNDFQNVVSLVDASLRSLDRDLFIRV